MQVLTTEQMKRAEALTNKAGLTYLEMMFNAGLRSYEFIQSQFSPTNCVILCGCGNNGGDGFVVAKKMAEAGCAVTVVLCCGESRSKTAEEAYNMMVLPSHVISAQDQPEQAQTALAGADVIVDAIFGTGFRGELDEHMATVVTWANAVKAARVSLDLPSGVNADTAEVSSVRFVPDITLAFAAYKPVHAHESAKQLCGRIVLLDIGIPNDIAFIVQNNITLINAKLCTSVIPKRNQHTHKGNYGRLVNIAGSSDMCGAAMMSTMGGMRVGAGLTTLVSTRYVTGLCAPQLMEATTFSLSSNERGGVCADDIEVIAPLLGRATACLVGCGTTASEHTRRIVEYVIRNADCGLVLDADALNVVSADLTILNDLAVPAVITPHIGEMARLAALTIEQVQRNVMETARSFAREHGVVVVLKTSRTIIASPEGEIFQNTTGNAGLAKGGSGDVLAGMIAGFLAQGMTALDAAVCGSYLHGLTADRLSERMSQYSMLARDLLDELPATLKSLDR